MSHSGYQQYSGNPYGGDDNYGASANPYAGQPTGGAGYASSNPYGGQVRFASPAPPKRTQTCGAMAPRGLATRRATG